MAAENMRQNFSILPRELTLIILSKLPFKAIFRCKSVCKNWLDIVTVDPKFAETHYDNSSMVLVCPKAIIDGFIKKPKPDTTYRFDIRNTHSEIWYGVVNSCKGFLLMLEQGHRREAVVYNPLTKETVYLPDLPFRHQRIGISGLGFSPVTKLFKVFMFITDETGTYSIDIHTLGRTSKTGARRMVTLSELHILKAVLHNPVELNGILHWKPLKQDQTTCIGCFDVEKEEAYELTAPYIGKGKCMGSFGVYKGLLFVAINTVPVHQVEMWVMKEYGMKDSWTRFIVVDLMELALPKNSRGQPTLVNVVESGELIFVQTWFEPENNTYLFSYDPIKKSFQKLHLPEDYIRLIHLYNPSFFSLKLQN